jgi:uncharacterized membrane protein
VLVPVLLASLLTLAPEPSWAARGGRIGGGSFRAPSMPRSYNSGGAYRGGGGFGGGFGFPFIIPIFGFGGGGLFGFLILMAIVGVLVNAVRGGGGGALSGGGPRAPIAPATGPVSILQLQVGLLASAKDLQADLRRLAASADTSTSSGLQRVLQDTTLALLRHPELWVYAHAESGQVPFQAAETTFNRLSMTERSKLQAEVTSNVGGQRSGSSAGGSVGDADATSDFIVVTVLAACRSRMTLRGTDTAQELSETLRVLGSVSSSELMALEVIWQPEGAGDVLSSEELITNYPDLQHL